MIYYAKLDGNDVIGVDVLEEEVISDCDGVILVQMGFDFLRNINNEPVSIWKQTFKDVSQRKHYAHIGCTYDAGKDAFIHPKPFPSWVLDEDTCEWDAPVDYPIDGEAYFWDEEKQQWLLAFDYPE